MMLPTFLTLFIFALGLSVGSFLNVLVLRFGFGETALARSHCMACNAPIRPYDLVPVFSYLALAGSCRDCGSRLSIQYPLVEIATGTLFVLAFLRMPPVISLWPVIAFLGFLVFLAALVALVAYDIRHTLVPLPFIYVLGGAAFIAVAAQSFFSSSFLPLSDGLAGGAIIFGFFWGIVRVTRGKGMGMGDGYVAGAAGLLLGLLRGMEAVMLGVWSATLVYLSVLLFSFLSRRFTFFPKHIRITTKTELPFVPFLALGVFIAVFTDFSPLASVNTLVNSLWFGN
jgi:prepilin signal peptidase PulO-like enzyme (type II secretory pathway)